LLSIRLVIFTCTAAVITGCSSSSTSAAGDAGGSHPGTDAATKDASAKDTGARPVDGGAPFIGSLTITTIGSTVDPINGDQNPYGLAIAPVTSGKLTAGDLVICNFNNAAHDAGSPDAANPDAGNVQGLGTTITYLHPTPGSTPQRLVQDPHLLGCAALALANDDAPWAASYSSNLAPYYNSSGVLESTLEGGPWNGPWGETYAPAFGPNGSPSYVTANATSGTIVRVNVSGTTFTTIASGFTLNDGAAPGTIYGASGLTYDAVHDTLFVVDSNQNRVVAFAGYSTLGENAVVVKADGTFGGPSATSASVLFSGAPLSEPISAAQLWNGDLVVGNTGGEAGQNLLVEISLAGRVVATQNLDTGAAGALFGIVATGTNATNARIYFNDDNTNTVNQLAPP